MAGTPLSRRRVISCLPEPSALDLRRLTSWRSAPDGYGFVCYWEKSDMLTTVHQAPFASSLRNFAVFSLSFGGASDCAQAVYAGQVLWLLVTWVALFTDVLLTFFKGFMEDCNSFESNMFLKEWLEYFLHLQKFFFSLNITTTLP